MSEILFLGTGAANWNLRNVRDFSEEIVLH